MKEELKECDTEIFFEDLLNALMMLGVVVVYPVQEREMIR
jgi:hypothetical protein